MKPNNSFEQNFKIMLTLEMTKKNNSYIKYLEHYKLRTLEWPMFQLLEIIIQLNYSKSFIKFKKNKILRCIKALSVV